MIYSLLTFLTMALFEMGILFQSLLVCQTSMERFTKMVCFVNDFWWTVRPSSGIIDTWNSQEFTAGYLIIMNSLQSSLTNHIISHGSMTQAESMRVV